MPPHKHPNPSSSSSSSSHLVSPKEGKIDDDVYEIDNRIQNQDENDSDGVSYDGEKDGLITVNLAELRKEVQCPICLGIIRKTRTVMECLHRFCRECIDKSMRLGNNECPSCRTHCASRRSLRDDPNFDALIASMFPDIDKYEEEEMAFNEEDIARNKEIQDSITHTAIRQTEDNKTKRPSFLRDRRNNHVIELDEEEDENEPEDSLDSSYSDDGSRKKKYKRCKKKYVKPRTSKRSLPIAVADSIGVSAEVDSLTWGKGRGRSHSRFGGPRPATNNTLPTTQIPDQQKDSIQHHSMHFTLISINENIPSLSRPYVHCSPTFSVKHVCQYISMQTYVEADEIEVMMIKNSHLGNHILTHPSFVIPREGELHMLNENETLGEIQARYPQENLVLAYRRRMHSYGTERY